MGLGGARAVSLDHNADLTAFLAAAAEDPGHGFHETRLEGGGPLFAGNFGPRFRKLSRGLLVVRHHEQISRLRNTGESHHVHRSARADLLVPRLAVKPDESPDLPAGLAGHKGIPHPDGPLLNEGTGDGP